MGGVHPHDKQQNVEFTARDPWKQRRETGARRPGVVRPARQFVSYRDLVDLKDVDAVMIASPDHLHCLHLEAAIKAKKDAYVEKPLAMDMATLNRIFDLVKASAVVQMGTRCAATPQAPAARAFESGAIGKVSRIEQCRNSGKPYWYSWMERAEELRPRTWTGRSFWATGRCPFEQAVDRLVQDSASSPTARSPTWAAISSI